MILFLHNRYRTTGGEERVVDDLLWLVREQLGEDSVPQTITAVPGVPVAASGKPDKRALLRLRGPMG